ncbi:hypothetical protein AVEN_143161-1 [Araneus ventricosus]|uniref:Uncharacterized protein n=1 Tax=Araneus ventricosus TaxID=182803 RepID=A0A4Y2JUL1_ARAVE|nr:hypothetical protein AVEN_143161-1 [Araneus ventricosus]
MRFQSANPQNFDRGPLLARWSAFLPDSLAKNLSCRAIVTRFSEVRNPKEGSLHYVRPTRSHCPVAEPRGKKESFGFYGKTNLLWSVSLRVPECYSKKFLCVANHTDQKGKFIVLAGSELVGFHHGVRFRFAISPISYWALCASKKTSYPQNTCWRQATKSQQGNSRLYRLKNSWLFLMEKDSLSASSPASFRSLRRYRPLKNETPPWVEGNTKASRKNAKDPEARHPRS